MNNIKKATIVSFLCLSTTLYSMSSAPREEKENFVTASLMKHIQKLQEAHGQSASACQPGTSFNHDAHEPLKPLLLVPLAEAFAAKIRQRRQEQQ